jgi:hypothetical protein
MEVTVKKTFFAAVFATAGVLVVSTPAAAHHGQASYEPDKVITLKGTVTEWVWANPHCYLKLDVKDSSGTATHWVIETQNPVSISKGGWSRRTFAPGDEVTVTLQPVKSGAPLGLVRGVVLANGQTLGSGGDAPRAP